MVVNGDDDGDDDDFYWESQGQETKQRESVSHTVLSNSVTAWTVAHQAPLPFGFPRQEYWSG